MREAAVAEFLRAWATKSSELKGYNAFVELNNVSGGIRVQLTKGLGKDISFASVDIAPHRILVGGRDLLENIVEEVKTAVWLLERGSLAFGYTGRIRKFKRSTALPWRVT